MSETIQEIKERIQELKAYYGPLKADSILLKEKVIHTYSTRILDKLSSVFNKDDTREALLIALKQFFEENWKLINGTPLCYTALPESDITLFLCDVAKFVVDEENSNLGDGKKPMSIISLLMPTLATQSIRNQYEDLHLVGTNIQKILQTHILGREGSYLLPVCLLSELDTSSTANQLGNPYFDYDVHKEGMWHVDEKEYERLVEHSSYTKALDEAKKHYEVYLNDKSNLLGHLRQLSTQLHFNSVRGFGQEEDAGGGAYAAIIRFIEYYDNIGKDKRAEIPEEVKKELEKLFTLTSPGEDVEKNQAIKAAAEFEKCLANLRAGLESVMSRHESELNAISLQCKNKENLIVEARNQFNESKNVLKKAIDNGEYKGGTDKLPISLHLLHSLGIDFTISSQQDLATVKELNPDEIVDVFKEQALKEQFVKRFSTIDDLVIFSIEVPSEKLKALLKATASELSKKLISKLRDLSSLLIAFDVERCQIVCGALKDQISQELIKSANDLNTVLQSLTPEQRMVVLEACKDQLLQWINSADDLNKLLRLLTPEQRTVVFEACKDHLSKWINSACHLNKLLQLLTPEQRTVVFEACKDHLLKWINSAYDLSTVLKFLTPEQRTVVFKFCKDHLLKWINSADDLNTVLKFLAPEQCKMVLETYKGQLSQLIDSAYNFNKVLQLLTDEQCTVVFNAYQEQLPQWIISADDLSKVLQFLIPKQRTVVFNAYQEQLPQWIISADDLTVLQFLTPEQCKMVLKACKDRLGQLIASADDLNTALQVLTSEQCKMVLKVCKDRLGQLIASAYDLSEVIQFLTNEQGKMVLEASKDRLGQLIVSAYDLNKVLVSSTPEQGKMVLEASKNRLGQLIASAADLNTVLQSLTPKRCEMVFEACKGQFSKWRINSADDLHKVLPSLTLEQCTKFYEKLKQEQIEKFAVLLEKLNKKSEKCKKAETKKSLEDLCRGLSEAKKKYTQDHNYGYENFKTDCDKVISSARKDLQHYHGRKDFFAKLTLTVISLGTIPAILSTKSKIKTGKWKFGLFEPKAHNYLNKFSTIVEKQSKKEMKCM